MAHIKICEQGAHAMTKRVIQNKLRPCITVLAAQEKFNVNYDTP